MQPKERIIHHEIPSKPYEVVGQICSVHELLFPLWIIIAIPNHQKMERLSAGSLILVCKSFCILQIAQENNVWKKAVVFSGNTKNSVET